MNENVINVVGVTFKKYGKKTLNTQKVLLIFVDVKI